MRRLLTPSFGKDTTLRNSKDSKFAIRKFGYGSLVLAILLTAVTLGNSQDEKKVETIDATAMGTSTQLGKTVSVKLIIYRYSTEDDRAVLVDAFKKGQNQGLVDALSKMKPVGRIAITGTVGSDVAYIRLTKTDTGHKDSPLLAPLNRLIRFIERNLQVTPELSPTT